MEIRHFTTGLAAAALLATTSAAPALAQSDGAVADFYSGKSIELIVGYSPGGGYDTYARTLARHIGDYIPGKPNVIVRNMPGAGSLTAANRLYNVSRKDGTVMATFGRGIAFEPLFENKSARFKASDFNWIGSANNEVSICVAWHTTGVTSLKQVREKELAVGGTGTGADTNIFPTVLNNVLGTRFKIVSGYPGGSEVNLAMERGEVSGRCGWSYTSLLTSHPDWLKENKINILAQISTAKHPDLPNVPLVTEFADTDRERRILNLIAARQTMGRPYAMPPGVPEARVDAVRDAFMQTMKDPEFRKKAAQAKLELEPVSGADVQALVKDVYDSPKEIIEAARKALDSQ